MRRTTAVVRPPCAHWSVETNLDTTKQAPHWFLHQATELNSSGAIAKLFNKRGYSHELENMIVWPPVFASKNSCDQQLVLKMVHFRKAGEQNYAAGKSKTGIDDDGTDTRAAIYRLSRSALS